MVTFTLQPLVLAGVLLMASSAYSEGPSGRGSPAFDFRKKAEMKEGKRWTLQEWMEQKDRNRLMDLWLGMYAPSAYEFFIAGSYLSYDLKTSSSPPAGAEQSATYRSTTGEIGAYATIMGLQAEYENNIEESYNDLSGSLNLRLIGNSVQGTHLIASYGLRTRNQNNVAIRQQFAGVDLDLYMTKYFGLHGNYKHFVPATEAMLGEMTGSRTEGGAFIDFNAVRLFGNWYSEKFSTAASELNRTGIISGIKFFF